MKKTALSAILTAMVITVSANTGFAAEPAEPGTLSISGEATLLWERHKPKNESDSHNSEHTFKLNLSQQVADNLELFGRFAYRHFGGDDSSDSIHELDQYGIKLKTGNGLLTIGSQEATLGTLSGLVDLTEVGRDSMFKGVAWETGDDQEKVHLLGGRVDKNLVELPDDQKLLGFEVSKTMGDYSLAGEYLHVSDVPGLSSIYGIGVKRTVDKWEFSLEGLRSTAKKDSNGILAGVSYSPVENEAISATYRNLKANSVVTGVATYDANTKGVELAWEKSLSERWSVKLTHEWAEAIDTRAKERVASIETTYTF